MKKTSFLKKLTAMAATLAMTCVMAVGAFAAEPAVDYKLDSASISVGETWTMSVPAGGMYDWNLSSEYIAYGPSMADREGVLKQVGYETANGVSTITYEAMMPGTCTVTLTDRSFAKIAEATVTVTDGSAAPDTPSVDTPSTDNKAAETPAAASAPSAAAAVLSRPSPTRLPPPRPATPTQSRPRPPQMPAKPPTPPLLLRSRSRSPRTKLPIWPLSPSNRIFPKRAAAAVGSSPLFFFYFFFGFFNFSARRPYRVDVRKNKTQLSKRRIYHEKLP